MEIWLRSQYANRLEANPWVFYGARNRPVGDHLTGWTEACQRAGFEGLLFHDLRRSAVRNMDRAGFRVPWQWRSAAIEQNRYTGATTS